MPDPITLIVGALAAGATAAAKDVVSQAVKDAYNGLKTLIVSKYESNPNVGASLQTLEIKPDSSDIQVVVETALREVGADQDEEIQTKTHELRTRLEKENLLPKILYQGKVEGSGALAQGKRAVAAGASGMAVGGDMHGNVSLGGKQTETP